jgi:hypothetical protein
MNIYFTFLKTLSLPSIVVMLQQMKLKMTNSRGYDKIPIKVLENCKHVIISPLTYIINRSLATSIFPDRLKYSEIKSIYKNGDKNLICNYRHISLLTSFSNIFERVVFVRWRSLSRYSSLVD